MLNYIGNWGGIYGSVELRATDPASIERVYVRPTSSGERATFVVDVQNREARDFTGEVRVRSRRGVEGARR